MNFIYILSTAEEKQDPAINAPPPHPLPWGEFTLLSLLRDAERLGRDCTSSASISEAAISGVC